MKFAGLGFIIPATVAVCYFIGLSLDRFFHTHFLYIVFVLIGAAGGLFAMVREAGGKP